MHMKKEEMMKLQKELAVVIANFIEKHWDNQKKVDRPKCDLKVINVSHTKIEEDSLKQVSNLWTFEGETYVATTDKSKVGVKYRYSIIGNATIEFYSDGDEKKVVFSEVKKVVITHAEKL